MAVIKPFKAFRPLPELVAKVAALPYDVVSTKEAREMVKDNSISFLHVDKPEIDLDRSFDPHDVRAYEKARENLNSMMQGGIYTKEGADSLYIYRLVREGKTQNGIVACASIDDYVNNIIKKHENTLASKEQDRVNHVKYTGAHTGPILMAYRGNPEIASIVDEWTVENEPVYDFVSEDGISHTVWVINDDCTINKLVSLFSQVKSLYIADGHHRAAAAVRVGQMRRMEDPDFTGNEEYNYFLSVVFPDDELTILEYNRVIRDLNGLDEEELLQKTAEKFDIIYAGKAPFKPAERHTFGMYICGKWYGIRAKAGTFNEDDPVERLDVSILHNNLISPIFGIADPRNDNRIDFIGGIRGLEELERRVDSGEMKVAISMFPTSMQDLMSAADAGQIMPPKSTWFEPKLRSGLFIHCLD
ncbi:MAG: DUF1015 family protein [Tepidanaerobacteraceae bacterium]|jgi:uncharacterized protein (DUF1015 family)|nr:DUF1015 family protein [Tepidanaerobacteraceae bacterium]